MERIPDTAADPNKEHLRARIGRGADQDLLDLFGISREGETGADAAEIDSGRAEIFEHGVYTKKDLPYINPTDPEVLAVLDHEEEVYPAFQFDHPIIHPVAAEVNRIIKSTGEMLPWEHAFWWISNNSFLDGQTPMAVMKAGESNFLLEAVRREMNT